VPSGGSELESIVIVIGGGGSGGDGGREGGVGASSSPWSSPRIAGTPEEKEESLDDAIILERLSKGLVSNHFLFEQVLLTSSLLSLAMQGLLVTTSVPNMESVSSEESLLSTCFLIFVGLDLLHRPPMRGSGKQAPLLCT
jgi:hypothetical protein